MEELHFPIQRTTAMRLLGQFWTGIIPGQIIVGVLIFIGLFFLGNQEFSLISLIIFFLLFLPFALIIHQRFVKKGKRLMTEWCDIRFFTEEMRIEYSSGFPNTMKPDRQNILVTDNNKDITIKGDNVAGYHLRLGIEAKIDATRFGLWFNVQDAENAAIKLAALTKGKIVNETIDDHISNK